MSPRVKKGGNVKIPNFIWIPSFFLFIHSLLFSPRHPLNSKGRFVNLFGNFSPLCAIWCINALECAAVLLHHFIPFSNWKNRKVFLCWQKILSEITIFNMDYWKNSYSFKKKRFKSCKICYHSHMKICVIADCILFCQHRKIQFSL